MMRSVSGSKSTAVGKQKRNSGSRLRVRRRAFIMSGFASMLCWPHLDMTWASPMRLAIGLPSESKTHTRWLPQIGDIDVAIGIHGDIGRVIEQACLGIAGRARGRHVPQLAGNW